MRRVAAALDTGAASLYVYVPGRDGLLVAMLDRVIATIELDAPDPARWREQLHSLLVRMYRALAAHPGIAVTTLADPPPGEAVLGLAENLLGIQLAGGIDPQDAAWACDVFVRLVTAAVIEEDEQRLRGGTGDRREQAEQLRGTFAGLPPDRFPMLTGHVAEMVAGDADERFRFAVDVVTDGLVARRAGG